MNIKTIDRTRTIVDGVSTLRIQKGNDGGLTVKGVRLTVGTGRDRNGFASSIMVHLLQPDIDWLVEQLTNEEVDDEAAEPERCGIPIEYSGDPASDPSRCIKAQGHDGEHYFCP